MKTFKQKPIAFLIAVSGKGRYRLSMAALLILAGSVLYMGPYYIAYLIIERIISGSPDVAELFTLSGYAALFILGEMIFSGVAMTQSHIAAYNILLDLRIELASKLTRLPLGFYTETSSGFIKKIMMGDVEAIEEFIAHNLVDLLSVIFVPLVLFAWLASFNLPLAFMSVFPVAAGIGLQRFRMRLEEKNIMQFFRLKGEMNTTIIDFIRGMPVIKMFNQSVFSFKRYRGDAEKYSSYWINLNRSGAPFFALYALLMDSGIIFLLPAGAWLYLAGGVSQSTFLMFMFIGIGMTRYMKQLTGFGSNITQISKGVEQIISLLSKPEIEHGDRDKEPEHYGLQFSDVSFSYGKTEVLKDVSFSVKQGEMLALVGPSGAGKTTVGRLIPRFWDIEKGSITIGGVDIREFSSESLMKMVSFVFQDVFMFNDTVLENIRMGDEEITREEVEEYAKQARAHDFIMNMEDGYDTIIGPSGRWLSGGEQQRIAIARALAKNSPVVILDEATSYADVENESEIQGALNNLLKNRTVIVIAHRLSSIRKADKIIVMDDGRIIEEGEHDELMIMEGLYRRLWDQHTGVAEWEVHQENIINNTEGVPAC